MKHRHLPVLLLLLLLLSSCVTTSQSTTGRQSSGTPSPQKGTSLSCPSSTYPAAAMQEKESGNITLHVSGWLSSSTENALVLHNLDAFEKTHPNIHVVWSPIAGNYPTKMQANVTNGTVPDVFYLQPNMAPGYIKQNLLLNLSPYMARDNIHTTDYYSSLLTPFRCQNGNVYGLPKDWNTLALFYNKKLFQQTGAAFPAANWTWSDMRAAAIKVTRLGKPASSVYGLTLPANSSRWLAFLFAAGGSVLNKDGTQAVFDSQAGIDALTFYTSFQLQDNTSTLPATVVPAWDGDVFDAFGRQRAAMAIEGGWLIPYLKDTYSSLSYGIAPLPVAPGGTRGNLIFTNAWVASRTTKHPEAAWEFIKYMTGPEVQTSVLHAGFALPTRINVISASYLTQHPDIAVFFDAAQYGHLDEYGPQDMFIHDRLNLAVANVLLGNSSVQLALSSAEAQVNRELR